MKVLSSGLRVRETPSIDAGVVDYLSQAQVVTVQEIVHPETWAKLGDRRYAAIEIDGKKYMETV